MIVYSEPKPMHYPGALTDCAARVLQTVSRAGVWMPAPSALNFDQLRALLALRNAGYIEYASFGGYKIRANEYTVAQVAPKSAPATDDLSQVESIAISSHKCSALVTMRDGRKIMFKVREAKYLAGLIALAKAQGRGEPISYTGMLKYTVVKVA